MSVTAVDRLVCFMRETNQDNFDLKAARTNAITVVERVLPLQNLLQMGCLQNCKNIPHTWLFSTLVQMTQISAGRTPQSLLVTCFSSLGVAWLSSACRRYDFARCFEGDPGVSARERQTSQQRIYARSAKNRG